MPTPTTSYPGLELIDPDPTSHAPMTLSWFESDYSRETLLLMGNAEHEIETPSLQSETKILEEFVDLRRDNKQLTWMLQLEGKLIGVAWIELVENHNVLPPSVHLMIGDKAYRGRGIGKAVMHALVQYIKNDMRATVVYSRHLKSNLAVTKMNTSLGFTHDGLSYIDDNGLEWQNIKLLL